MQRDWKCNLVMTSLPLAATGKEIAIAIASLLKRRTCRKRHFVHRERFAASAIAFDLDDR